MNSHRTYVCAFLDLNPSKSDRSMVLSAGARLPGQNAAREDTGRLRELVRAVAACDAKAEDARQRFDPLVPALAVPANAVRHERILAGILRRVVTGRQRVSPLAAA